ncbi:MAG: hypothetical protein GF331_13585 [Chitinivibrionales bacterium]|nr:hypothetical protein [Chitinivibrionales bacterium]
MPDFGSYKNVFDDQEEFNKLNDLILGAIQEFSNYRQGNLTYGEIMFVLECVLDSLRGTSEKEAREVAKLKGLGEAPSFTSLLSTTKRLVESLVKKKVIDSADEAYILHGDE